MENIALKDLKPSPLNPRKHFDKDALKEMAESIKEKGVICPILVRHRWNNEPHLQAVVPDYYEIVSGECRFRASQMAGNTDIPAIARELTDQEVLEIQIIENVQRKDVHPLEEAEGYEALLKTDGQYKSVEDIAAKIGKSKGYIYMRLKLCELIPENRKLFFDGKFNPSVAVLVARIPAHLQKEAGRRLVALSEYKDEPVSYRRAAEFLTKEFMLLLKDAPFDTDDATLGPKDACSCTMCPKRTGNQKELFADLSADVCTDPACFKAKKEAGVKRALDKAKESGKTVLSERDAKKVFTGPASNMLVGYVNLEAVCEEDKQGRKYKQLVKLVKDAKIVVAINPHSGELVAMLTKAEAARIRKQLKLVPAKEVKEKKKAEKKQAQEVREEEHKQEQVRKEASVHVLTAVLDNVRRDKKGQYARAFAEGMLEAATIGVKTMFMRRRDPDLKGMKEIDAGIKEHLATIDDAELPVFCLELVILQERDWGSCGEESATAKKLCELYKINLTKPEPAPAPEEEKKEEEKTPEPEAPAAVKEPEKARVRRRSATQFEVGKGGKKAVVTTKGDMSIDEQQQAGNAIGEIADMLGGEGK